MKFTETLRQFYHKDPHRFLYWSILIPAFLIRLVISLSQWGILHPDEIFQSLEVAHKLVFGSGLIPPEFRNEPSHVPGYNAIRSYIFPLIFAAFMWLGKILGLNYFHVVLPSIKIFLAINSTLLLPVVYKLTFQLTGDKNSSLYAMFFTSIWFRIIEMTTRSLINTFFLPYLFYGIFLVLRSLERESITMKDVILVGICLGLVSYIRIDLGLIIFVFFIFTFKLDQWRKYIAYLLSSFSFWIIGAAVDYYMYEDAPFFTVPLKWVRFNIINHSSDLFGVTPFMYYVSHLLYGDLLLFWLIPIVVTWYNHRRGHERSLFYIEDDQRRKAFDLLFKTVFIIWVVYSYPIPQLQSFTLNPFQLPITIRQTHKEMRFLIGGLVLLIILIAVNIEEMVQGLIKLISYFPRLDHNLHGFLAKFHPTINRNQARRWSALLFLGFLLLSMNLLAASQRVYRDKSEDINLALMYVGQQDDVDAVLVMEVWFWTGQYTYSHLDQNVSIYWVYFANEQEAAISEEIISNFIFRLDNHRYFIIDTSKYPTTNTIYTQLQEQNFTQVKNFHSVEVFYAV